MFLFFKLIQIEEHKCGNKCNTHTHAHARTQARTHAHTNNRVSTHRAYTFTHVYVQVFYFTCHHRAVQLALKDPIR